MLLLKPVAFSAHVKKNGRRRPLCEISASIREMRNAARIKEWGDDFSLHFLSVSFMIVIAIILLGIMNSMTMHKLDAMRRNNGRPTLVLLDPITGEPRGLSKDKTMTTRKPNNGSSFVVVKNEK